MNKLQLIYWLEINSERSHFIGLNVCLTEGITPLFLLSTSPHIIMEVLLFLLFAIRGVQTVEQLSIISELANSDNIEYVDLQSEKERLEDYLTKYDKINDMVFDMIEERREYINTLPENESWITKNMKKS